MLLKAGAEAAHLQLIARVMKETHVRNGEVSGQRVGPSVLKDDVKSGMTWLCKIGPLRRVAWNAVDSRLDRYAELVRSEK